MLKKTLTLLCITLMSASWAGPGLDTKLVLLDQKIQSGSPSVELYVRRALILTDLGEFKRALADMDAAAQLGPAEQTYYARGVLFYRLGQFDTAITLFSQYLEKYPDQQNALLFRARVLRDSQQTEKALNDYLRYLHIVADAEPGTYLAATQLMTTLIEQGNTKYDQAAMLALLDKRIALGQASQLQGYAIDIVKRTCKAEQVIQRLNQLPKQSKNAPQWHLQLAEQYWLLKDAKQTEQHLQAAYDVIQKKRASAFKAEQMHRYRFLQELQKQGLQTPPNSQASFAAIYQRFYPTIETASPDDTPAHHHHKQQQAHSHDDGHSNSNVHSHSKKAHAHGGGHTHKHATEQKHTHSPLADLQQPKKAGPHYRAAWAEPVKAFYQCAVRVNR